MLYSPANAPTNGDRDLLKSLLRRYAARYYIIGRERDALIAETITALAEEPEVLLDRPVEQAIAEAMRRLFIANMEKVPPCDPLVEEPRPHAERALR